MGRINMPQPVKLIAGILYREEHVRETAYEKLRGQFGEIDCISEAVPFNLTAYYSEEMGNHLIRQFIGFKRLIFGDYLPQIKKITNEIENVLSRPGTVKRRVNIDPGYLAAEKLVLASTKNFSHRIYLADGIYADLSYRFIHGTYRPLEWTYPDYRTEETILMFNSWRESYLKNDQYKLTLYTPNE